MWRFSGRVHSCAERPDKRHALHFMLRPVPGALSMPTTLVASWAAVDLLKRADGENIKKPIRPGFNAESASPRALDSPLEKNDHFGFILPNIQSIVECRIQSTEFRRRTSFLSRCIESSDGRAGPAATIWRQPATITSYGGTGSPATIRSKKRVTKHQRGFVVAARSSPTWRRSALTWSPPSTPPTS